MSEKVARNENVPITLISGYLGTGKTTLINKLLSHPALPPDTAVLVNDFGDINVDESLVRSASADGTVIGLSNGCICRSISDDLSKALDELHRLAVTRHLGDQGIADRASLATLPLPRLRAQGRRSASRRVKLCGARRTNTWVIWCALR